MVSMTLTLHINDYTAEEVNACWVNDEECQASKEDVKACLSLIEMGALRNDTKVCCRRGLEFQTPNGAARRMANKEIGWDAVSLVQETQREQGWNDPTFLAKVYYAHTKRCLQEAHFRALCDAKDASF
jgi:hypothetical protein